VLRITPVSFSIAASIAIAITLQLLKNVMIILNELIWGKTGQIAGATAPA
jgi:hypothetical protein